MRRARHRSRVMLVDDGYYSILAAARALRAAGFSPWIASSEPVTYATHSRAVAGVAPVPDPGFDREGFVSKLAAAAARLSIEVVLPGAETHLHALAGREEEFSGITLGVPSRERVERATDKGTLPELARASGLQTPPTVEVSCGDSGSLGAFGFPAIVKPPRSRFPGPDGTVSGSARFVSSEHADEAHEALRHGGSLVQPYIPGTLSSISGVAWEGELVCALHQRAIRIWPMPAGVSAYAETTSPDRDLERGVGRLLGTLGWSGIFQAQFIRSQSGEDYLIDLNPRIYGSLSLATEAGLNFPAIWLDLLLGRRPDIGGGYRVGVRFRQEENDARILATMLMNGELRNTLRVMTPRLRTAHAVFSLRDPMPLFVSAAKLMKRIGR